MPSRRTILASAAALAVAPSSAWAVERMVTVAIVGQSNEQGAGQTPSRSEPPGFPMADPVPPGGGQRSLWPELSTLLGRAGVSFEVRNTAVGATSLADSWVGRVRAWRRNMLLVTGCLVISDGGVWLCAKAPHVVDVSRTPPSADPVPDAPEWRRLGEAQGYQVDGRVLGEGQVGFDPNGYLARAWSEVGRAAPGRERWAFVSIGQGDKVLEVARAQYAAALTSTCDFFLKRGCRVALGFTCAAATANAETWYKSELVPGWRDALAHYRGNPRVIAGANLYEALGQLPVTPASGPGLQADRVHMNDAAYSEASKAWFEALKRAGW